MGCSAQHTKICTSPALGQILRLPGGSEHSALRDQQKGGRQTRKLSACGVRVKRERAGVWESVLHRKASLLPPPIQHQPERGFIRLGFFQDPSWTDDEPGLRLLRAPCPWQHPSLALAGHWRTAQRSEVTPSHPLALKAKCTPEFQFS